MARPRTIRFLGKRSLPGEGVGPGKINLYCQYWLDFSTPHHLLPWKSKLRKRPHVRVTVSRIRGSWDVLGKKKTPTTWSARLAVDGTEISDLSTPYHPSLKRSEKILRRKARALLIQLEAIK